MGGGLGSWSLAYEDIISVENLLDAWREFVKGKRKRKDVQEFERYLMQNILTLHRKFVAGTYQHGGYHHFKISDPKPRDIHKASVRDRLMHHALYRKLYPFFDCTFISDSYSCRLGKGTHKAMNRFRTFARNVSRNDTRTCWILKCDIRKFFASIDQKILMEVVSRYLPDERVCALVAKYRQQFLFNTMCCTHKVSIKTLASGVDFLGWVHFHDHRVLRTATKNRMFRRIEETDGKEETVQSYLGLLSHGNAHKLQAKIISTTM